MVDVSQANVVAILSRAPSSGGKTRLFAALGREPDPSLLSALLLDTLDGVEATGVIRLVAVDPPDCCDEVRAIVPGDIDVRPQCDGDLGDRMHHLMMDVLGHGAKAVALVGSDVPEITDRPVLAAFATLEREPQTVVLGPAVDGGYYLIAATRAPELFNGVEWGTDAVLEQTIDAAARRGVRVRIMETVADVDGPDDLRRVTTTRPNSRTARWYLSRIARQ